MLFTAELPVAETKHAWKADCYTATHIYPTLSSESLFLYADFINNVKCISRVYIFLKKGIANPCIVVDDFFKS